MSSPLMRYCRSLGRYEEGLRAALEAYAFIVEGPMGFPRDRELESSSALSWATDCGLSCLTAASVASLVEGAEVCVVTPGFTLGSSKDDRRCDVVLATDSSYETLARLNLRPDVIVGDADASLRLLRMSAQLDAPFLIHAHGDNLHRVSCLIRSLSKARVVVTTQIETPYCTLPIGAFTDGDRAAALALAFRARSVLMEPLELKPYCFHKDYCDAALKGSKLALAREVLSYVAARTGYSLRFTGDKLVIERS